MLRFKIYLTIFFVYEIIATILLHTMRTCAPMFGISFCNDVVFKYFVVCAAVPMVVFLIVMWVHEIVVARHRRRSVFYRVRSAAMRTALNVKRRVARNVSQQDLEKIITAALVVGIKKYAARNANVRRFLDDITNAYYMDDEFDDDDDDDVAIKKSHRAKSRTAKK